MIESLFSMQDKICVVTGGSRGLGAFMAQGFLESGAKCVYITARKAEACIKAAEELCQYGECVAIPGDIATSEGLQNLVQELMNREQHIDVLVNNAGTGWGAPFGEFPEKGWDKVMDVNVKSPFFLTQALAPLLKKNATAKRSASVINIGSIAGVAIMLASQAGEFITGQIIPVDGGTTLVN
jgi:NAD(P)-dependent dehydrogenase (short-subunit alcohol dehydrogenase family)